MLIENHFPAKRWDRLPACRRLLFPFVSRATKEIGDVCTQAMGQVRRVQASLFDSREDGHAAFLHHIGSKARPI